MRWLGLLAVVLALAGCRDLSLSEAAGDNAGPTVRFVGLEAGAELSLRPVLELAAEDVDGIGFATLSCAPGEAGPFVSLGSWRAPPYRGQVDLGPCVAGRPQGELLPVALRAEAQDALGAGGESTLLVEVNTRLPSLSLEVLPRVRPGATVVARVVTDPSAVGVPSVTLNGAPVPIAATASPTVYEATFVARAVGADRPGADSSSLAVLEELELSFVLSAAVVGEGGNRAEVRREVLSSRVAWERPAPARVHESLGRAGPAGLWLPLKKEDSMGSAFWRPGFFAAADGAFVAPPVGLTNGRDFGKDGLPLVESGGQVPFTQRVGVEGAGAEVNGALPFGPVVRLPDRTCVVVESRLPWATTCDAGTVALECFVHSGTFAQTTPVSFAANLGGPPEILATSGEVMAGVSLKSSSASCKTDLERILWSTPTATTAGGTIPNVGTFRRLLPVGETGTFIVVFEEVGTRVLKAGRIANGQYQPLAASLPVADLVVALPDERIVGLQTHATSTTLLRLYGPGTETTATVPLPLERVTPADGDFVPRDVVAFSDGRVAFLARASDFSRVVVATDASLNPRWIYRYPRGAQNAYLAGDAASGRLYFVDVEGSHVVALFSDW